MENYLSTPCVGYTSRPGDGKPIPVYEMDEYFNTADGANYYDKTRRLSNGARLYQEARHEYYCKKYGRAYADSKSPRNPVDEKNAPVREGKRRDLAMIEQNGLVLFQHETFGQVRTVQKDGEPWFVAADVCGALEITNPTDAVKRLDDDERARFNLGHPYGDTNIINEPGLYTLVLGSRKPEARAFKRWITHEVIPSIRKYGVYANSSALDNASTLRAQAMLLNAKTRQASLWTKLGDMLPESPTHRQICASYASEALTGQKVLPLPAAQATYTATEIGAMFGLSKNKIGSLANQNGLKTDEYGITVMDKSPYSSKEMPSFRYNDKAVARFKEILGN